MWISTGKVLLALLGFLYYERSAAMDLNHAEQPREFPPNQIRLEMDDGCTTDGEIEWSHIVPPWIQPNQPHPNQLVFYFKDATMRLSGVFREPLRPSRTHDPAHHHTPKSVQIHTRFFKSFGSRYFAASPFSIYHLQNQQGPTPPGKYVYVSVPNSQVYRAPLEFVRVKNGTDFLECIHPGLASMRDRIMKDVELWGMK